MEPGRGHDGDRVNSRIFDQFGAVPIAMFHTADDGGDPVDPGRVRVGSGRDDGEAVVGEGPQGRRVRLSDLTAADDPDSQRLEAPFACHRMQSRGHSGKAASVNAVVPCQRPGGYRAVGRGTRRSFAGRSGGVAEVVVGDGEVLLRLSKPRRLARSTAMSGCPYRASRRRR